MQRAARCSCKRSTVKWWGIVAARGRAIPLNGATITYLPMRKRRIDIATRGRIAFDISHVRVLLFFAICIFYSTPNMRLEKSSFTKESTPMRRKKFNS